MPGQVLKYLKKNLRATPPPKKKITPARITTSDIAVGVALVVPVLVGFFIQVKVIEMIIVEMIFPVRRTRGSRVGPCLWRAAAVSPNPAQQDRNLAGLCQREAASRHRLAGRTAQVPRYNQLLHGSSNPLSISHPLCGRSGKNVYLLLLLLLFLKLAMQSKISLFFIEVV